MGKKVRLSIMREKVEREILLSLSPLFCNLFILFIYFLIFLNHSFPNDFNF